MIEVRFTPSSRLGEHHAAHEAAALAAEAAARAAEAAEAEIAELDTFVAAALARPHEVDAADYGARQAARPLLAARARAAREDRARTARAAELAFTRYEELRNQAGVLLRELSGGLPLRGRFDRRDPAVLRDAIAGLTGVTPPEVRL